MHAGADRRGARDQAIGVDYYSRYDGAPGKLGQNAEFRHFNNLGNYPQYSRLFLDAFRANIEKSVAAEGLGA